MYDELVKRLRNCSTQAAPCKTCDMTEDGSCSDTLMKQAADAIEELSAIREEQKAQIIAMAAEIEEQQPRWIPVTERLPKEGEFVLVYGDLYPNKHDGCVIAVSKRMDWNYWQGFGRERDITHWMPLPQPPKEE